MTDAIVLVLLAVLGAAIAVVCSVVVLGIIVAGIHDLLRWLWVRTRHRWITWRTREES